MSSTGRLAILGAVVVIGVAGIVIAIAIVASFFGERSLERVTSRQRFW